MPLTQHRPLAVYYEHPDWFRPLFAELERRGVPDAPLHVTEHSYDPGDWALRYGLVFNRMSPSAYLRDQASALFYTLHALAHLEQTGVRVINGAQAYRVELAKEFQLTLLKSLGLPFPAARVIHDPCQAPGAARGLRFPVVVKPNVGGSGAGIRRFETPVELARAANAGPLDLGPDHTALVQECIPARDGCITRVEALGGRATPVCADPVPAMYRFVPGLERFRQAPDPDLEYDLIVVGDCADLSRAGSLVTEHADLFRRGRPPGRVRQAWT